MDSNKGTMPDTLPGVLYNSIAIDLGSANVRVAAIIHGTLRVFKDASNDSHIPAMLTFLNGKRLVGISALNTYSGNVIADSTQDIHNGRQTTQNHKKLLCFPFSEKDEFNDYHFDVGKTMDKKSKIKEISQVESIATILDYLKSIAEKHVPGMSVKNVTIAVPSAATNSHRLVVQQAAKVVGFKSVTLINQTTAAAIEFLRKNDDVSNDTHISAVLMAIVCIGARSTEVSVYGLKNPCTSSPSMKLLSTSARSDFGGENFTEALVWASLERLNKGYRKKIRRGDKRLAKFLREEAESVKIKLSSLEEITISSQFSAEVTFSRKEFEEICRKQFVELDIIVSTALVGYKGKLDRVLFVGGGSRMPKVKELLVPYLTIGGTGFVANVINELAVISGAAIKANKIDESIESVGVAEHSFRDIVVHSSVSQNLVVNSAAKLPFNSGHKVSWKTLVEEKEVFQVYENSDNDCCVMMCSIVTTAKNQQFVLSIDNNGIIKVNQIEAQEMTSAKIDYYGKYALLYAESLSTAEKSLKKYRQAERRCAEEQRKRDEERVIAAKEAAERRQRELEAAEAKAWDKRKQGNKEEELHSEMQNQLVEVQHKKVRNERYKTRSNRINQNQPNPMIINQLTHSNQQFYGSHHERRGFLSNPTIRHAPYHRNFHSIPLHKRWNGFEKGQKYQNPQEPIHSIFKKTIDDLMLKNLRRK